MKARGADAAFEVGGPLVPPDGRRPTGPRTDASSVRAAMMAAGPRDGGGSPSSRASEMARLRSEIARAPDVRVTLVGCLRSEIEDGRYRTDGRRIADALLQEFPG